MLDFNVEIELDSWSMLITQSIIDEVSKEEAEKLLSINRQWITDDIREAHKEEIVEMDNMLNVYIEHGKVEALEFLESV